MERVITPVSLPEGADLRSISTGKTIRRASLTPSSGEEKLLPHYLRASTSSCHDFCKYGRKHAFEAKGRKSVSRKLMGDIVTTLKNQNQIKNVNLAERKEKPLIKLKASPELKTELSDKPKITSRKVSLPTKKIEVSDKHVISLKLTPTVAKSPELKIELSSKPKITVQKALMPAKKIEISDKHVIATKLTPVGTKSSSPSSPSRGLSGRRKGTSSPLDSSRGLNSRRNSEPSDSTGGVGGRGNTGLLKPGEKKLLKPPILSLSPRAHIIRVPSSNQMKYGNTKVASLATNRSVARKPSGEKVREKTLYVIKLKPVNKIIEPVRHRSRTNRSHPSLLSLLPSSTPPSSCRLLSLEDEERYGKSEPSVNKAGDSFPRRNRTKSLGEISKCGGNMMLRRVATVGAEDKCVQEKLRFRRGKVVSVESETNTPRRLRFRQGRALAENTKVEAGRRSFRRKRMLGGSESNSANPESLKVVLRHQDMQGKKEEQGLLNDVIEETANKLVETRKSKVKALVGAFETVISLQESKPAAAATATTATV
ncbi:uncharacterized protein LOC131228700 [Magnolia sinica]|uniref:uncharacterized protein LOC131228700 n=1 Tax=Magnolia sinica TaxID=86752 RepID=UPI00265B4865|nr:uncharacterized protein LOC131228700 [Magnolia sinica]XP_058080525.1 uncharacterized protein LOC131228700 [Magnolia sinica]XP_058080526.1 uncharacterized protein LOC131228700 [Magnolia sinica]XP_058080527.1 uncharacterized protein LOC131228700 [Magnolia sinica]XP_058080528.1 uncharacterized protein LOC131228700 [Magnolia sinica]XP_058080529.1 uncharacterized protein LOC131228700 [Magnolia sinica]